MSLSWIEAADPAELSDNFEGAVVDTCWLLAFDGLSSRAWCIGAASRGGGQRERRIGLRS